MKKTLIALMALAGVAAADITTITTEWNFDNNLTSTGSVVTTGSWVKGQDGLTEATYGVDDVYGSYLVLDGKGYVKVNNTYWSTGSGTLALGSNDTSFTISATVMFDSIPSEIFLMGTSNNHDEGFAFTLMDGKLALTAKSIAHNTLNSMTALTADTWYTLGVSYDAETNVANFSVNGNSVGTLTLSSGYDAAEAVGMAIGAGGADQAQGVWSGKIANLSITTTVPEPTTATLSLLALAGLAARRRRK
mgnify:CR=1 FL=1